MQTTVAASTQKRPLLFLVVLSVPAFTLAMAFGVNNPSIYHLVLSRFVDNGLLDESRVNSALGLLGICGLTMSALAQPLFGFLSDRTHTRFGRRYPYMLFGGVILLFTILWEIHSPNIWMLIGAVLATQVALSAVQSPLHALIPDQVPRDQMGLASGIKTVLELIGVILGGALVWIFLGDADRPEIAAIIIGLLVLLAVVITLKNAPETPVLLTKERLSPHARYLRLHQQSQMTITTYVILLWMSTRHVLRRRAFMWWLLHRVCLFGSFGIISKFTITYLIDVFGFTGEQAREMQGQLIVILGVLIMATPIIAGILSDRIGRRRLVIIGGVIAAFGTFGISQSRSLLLAVTMMGITGVGTSIFFSVGWALVTSIVPTRQAAFYMGITNIATSLGTAIGLSGGFIVDMVNDQTNSTRQGYMVILLMASVFYLMSAFAIYQTRDRQTVPQLRTQVVPMPH